MDGRKTRRKEGWRDTCMDGRKIQRKDKYLEGRMEDPKEGRMEVRKDGEIDRFVRYGSRGMVRCCESHSETPKTPLITTLKREAKMSFWSEMERKIRWLTRRHL